MITNNSKLATSRTPVTAGANQGVIRPRRTAIAPPITVSATQIAATATTHMGMMYAGCLDSVPRTTAASAASAVVLAASATEGQRRRRRTTGP